MSAAPRARDLKLLSCHACGLVLDNRQDLSHSRCPRCDEHLYSRKPDSIKRSWAYLIAATILYIPANLLPIMLTTKMYNTESSTIVSGVIELWQSSAYDLAVIVFTASVVVPILKIVLLSFLLISTQRRSTWRQKERTRLYRVLEYIGHWSMLDVFVVALLITLVHFHKLALVQAGPGIVAFGAVVVLTMLSSISLDPRLIWDTEEPRDRAPLHNG
jgi:paraquat-inducible protein A